MKKLLVVIPCYNDLKIVHCVKSVQRYIKNADIIVIDDGSNNEVELSIRKLAVDGYIHVERNHENRGISYSRNKGIEYGILAGYENIMFVDSDDELIGEVEISKDNDCEVSFYNSIEVYKDDKKGVFVDNMMKKNISTLKNIELILIKYIETPNKISEITTSWAKIFSLKLINEKKIRFNEMMSTFEDVDFNVRCLRHAKKCEFSSCLIYAHLNVIGKKTATFGNGNINSLFSFLVMTRSLEKLIKSRNIQVTTSLHHLRAAYYSISFVRAAALITGLKEFIDFYSFIKRRCRSPLVNKAFLNYDAKIANGRKLVKILIILNKPLLLAPLLFIVAKKRYGDIK